MKPVKIRLWIPVALLVASGTAMVLVRSNGETDQVLKTMWTLILSGVTILLLLIWLLLLSGLRWRTRLLGFAGFVAALALIGATFRMEGSLNGSAVPRLVPRWAPRKDFNPSAAARRSSAGLAISNEVVMSAEFTQFLGATRRAEVTNVHLARDWATRKPRELWRQPIGLGWSAFAVKEGRAITQEQRGAAELVAAYELATGRALWSHTNHVRFREAMGGDGPRATPTIDGDHLFALGATGMLDRLEAATGKRIWSRDVLVENQLPNLEWGKSSSPLLVDDLVVVTGGGAKEKTLLAYRQETGELAWASGEDKASYASPVLATLAGRRQILIVNAASVAAHDPKDGAMLWKYPWGTEGAPKCSQPVAIGNDRVFLSAGYAVGCVLLQVKADAAGQLSVVELWKNRNLKTQFANVSVRDQFVYGLDDGILTCLDLQSGERKWKSGRYASGQSLLVRDLLLIQAESGPLALVEANPIRYQELGRMEALSSKTWNNPVLAGPFLLVRNDQEAACYLLETESL